MIEDRLVKRGYVVKYEILEDKIILYYDDGSKGEVIIDELDAVKKELDLDSYNFSKDYYSSIKHARENLIAALIYGSWVSVASTFFIATSHYASLGTLSYILFLFVESITKYSSDLKEAGINKVGLIKLSKALKEYKKYQLYFDNLYDIEQFFNQEREGNLINCEFDGTVNSLSDLDYKELKKFVKKNIKGK